MKHVISFDSAYKVRIFIIIFWWGFLELGQCSPGKDGLSERCLRDLLHGCEYVLTYEDKDGDWMLVGDVPWE